MVENPMMEELDMGIWVMFLIGWVAILEMEEWWKNENKKGPYFSQPHFLNVFLNVFLNGDNLVQEIIRVDQQMTVLGDNLVQEIN